METEVGEDPIKVGGALVTYSSMTAPRFTLPGAISWIPLAGFLVLIVFATNAYLRVGHWPYYSHPDPKELRLPWLRAASLLAVPVTLLSSLVGLVSLVASPHRWRKIHAILFLAGLGLWASIFWPHNLLAWVAD